MILEVVRKLIPREEHIKFPKLYYDNLSEFYYEIFLLLEIVIVSGLLSVAYKGATGLFFFDHFSHLVWR